MGDDGRSSYAISHLWTSARAWAWLALTPGGCGRGLGGERERGHGHGRGLPLQCSDTACYGFQYPCAFVVTSACAGLVAREPGAVLQVRIETAFPDSQALANETTCYISYLGSYGKRRRNRGTVIGGVWTSGGVEPGAPVWQIG